MIKKTWVGFKDRFQSIFESQKADINEDIPRMVLYLNKHYSPHQRIAVIEGVMLGIDESLKREIEFFKNKYEESHSAREELNNKNNYNEKT